MGPIESGMVRMVPASRHPSGLTANETSWRVLATEFGAPEEGGMHALALTLRTPEEHAAQAGR